MRAMHPTLEAIAPQALLRRWQSLDNRALLTVLAGVLASHLSLLSLLTQPPDEAINTVLVLGGAVLVHPDLPQGWQPRPGRGGRWLGLALLVAVLWRSQRMVGFDFVSSLLPLLAGLGLALLALPWREVWRVRRPLAVLAFLPLMRALGWLIPLGPLSLATAWISQQLLTISGLESLRFGSTLRLPGGGVTVAGPCAGLNMLLQLAVVAVIFAIAFPMRHRWQNALMILVAPLLAMLINAIRIVLLALINVSDLPHKLWWFDFFHWHWGSLLFAGIAMQLFVWLYVYWLARQVAALGTR